MWKGERSAAGSACVNGGASDNVTVSCAARMSGCHPGSLAQMAVRMPIPFLMQEESEGRLCPRADEGKDFETFSCSKRMSPGCSSLAREESNVAEWSCRQGANVETALWRRELECCLGPGETGEKLFVVESSGALQRLMLVQMKPAQDEGKP